jgi:hypothetical protein
MAAKERALDIFMLLGELDKKNYYIWDALSEDQQKEFSALVTMRWMAGTTDQRQLIMLNEIVNTSVFSLPDRRELMMKLLAVCSSGDKKRYSWINYKLSSAKKNKMAIQLISEHYGMSIKDAEDTLRLFSADEIMELGEACGLQKEELQLLKKEIKNV